MARKVLRTELCDLLGIEYPILQAGMGALGRATPPKLVAAVSDAGGMGFCACAQNSPDWVRRNIREIRKLTDRPFGMNVMFPSGVDQAESAEEIYNKLPKEYPEHVAWVKNLMKELGLPWYDFKDWGDLYKGTYSREVARQQIEVILEEKVPVVSAGLGIPPEVVKAAHAQGAKVMATSGSVRNAIRQAEAGVDIVVAQGYEAGGHTGHIATLPLVLSVIEAVSPVPVVAAGGIANGRGLVAALALGAVGVWCGTAFLIATESDVYPEHQENIIRGRAEDWTITRCYTGKTARHYRNKIIEAWGKSDLPPLPMSYETVLLNHLVASAAKHGKPEYIYNPAGQIVSILKERKPAHRIVEEMIDEAIDILHTLPQVLKA